MQFRLRTLLIVLAVVPVVLAGTWWAWLAVVDARDMDAAIRSYKTPGDFTKLKGQRASPPP